jgi:hypothetical protein
MPPQRKKAKTTYVAPPEAQTPARDPLETLHPDLAAASEPPKLDPEVLHPDLAAASTLPSHQSATDQPDQLQVENAIPGPRPRQPRQRKNATAASRAAAAIAAQLQLQQQQQQFQQSPEGQEVKSAQETELGESAVSVDTAAEFLRTIQERESQKSLLAMQGRPESGPVAADGSLPTDMSALYSITQAQPQPSSYQGYPTAAQFEEMVNDYLGSLSVKKQTKALLPQQMYDDILAVLLNPTDTKTGSAQFRFWAKKMFKLVSTQVAHIVIHENRPVAVKEQLYDVLVQCHGQANHGGRDKTAAQVFRLFHFA